MTKVAFLGAGNMAEAFCRGLLAKKVLAARDLCAADIRPPSQIPWLKELGVKNRPAAEAVKDASVIFLSVKPKDMAGLLQAMAGKSDTRGKLFISIAAGVPLKKIEGLLGPGARVVRVMPNTPALVGRGASAYCAGRNAGPADLKTVAKLLGSVGFAMKVARESDLDAVTAVSGSGPAYYFRFLEDFHAAGCAAGLSREACFKLAAQTFLGAAEMVARVSTIEEVSTLREKVTSPGGTTAEALAVFEKKDLRKIVKEAVLAAKRRSEELGK